MAGTRYPRLIAAAIAACATSVVNAQLYNPSDPSSHPPDITKDGTTLSIIDFASTSLSGTGGSITSFGANSSTAGQLGRLNFLRAEPTTNAAAPLLAAASNRFFVVDNNRNLYILNKSTANGSVIGAGFTSYINFQSVFPEFDNNPGYAGGLVTVQFDPGYADATSAGYGKFYTVHTENLATTPTASAKPISLNLPGLSGVSSTVGGSSAYDLTSVLNPPAGTVARQGVLVEWTDTNPADATFQGTAREVLRVGFNGNIHPMGDLAFNPLAQPGDADYRNLYIAMGDGGAGETTASSAIYLTPQRLDALPGKVLRITPDINLHPADQFGSNGSNSYRIPSSGTDKNPFVGIADASVKDEIYAYGFRNVHRLSFDKTTGKLIGNDIGLYSFEEVNIIEKGGNYGWSEREGTRLLGHASGAPGDSSSTSIPGARTSALPGTDTIPIRISNTAYVANLALGTTTTTAGSAQQSSITYPVAQYFQTEGDAIASGFVYRGTALQGLQGKYIFGDITTGRIFFADFAEMMAASDTNPNTIAAVHELSFLYNGQPKTIYELVAAQFAAKGGALTGGAAQGVLPGFAANVGGDHGGFDPANQGTDSLGNPIYDLNPNEHASNPGFTPDYGGGRADIRLAEGPDGELYILSKSDGMIRMLSGTVALGTGVPEPGTIAIFLVGCLALLRRKA
jgi:hypothetical protein